MRNISDEIYEAEAKAWQALSKYKFIMFGYWAAVWVHLNRIEGKRRPNPFKKLVGFAKKEAGSEKVVQRHPGLFYDVAPKV